MISHLLENVGKTRILGWQPRKLVVCDSNLKRGATRLLAALRATVISSPTINKSRFSIRIVGKNIFLAYLSYLLFFFFFFSFFLFLPTKILKYIKSVLIYNTRFPLFNR